MACQEKKKGDYKFISLQSPNPVRVAWSFRRPVEWVQPYIVHRKRPPTFHFRINENQLLMIMKPYVKNRLY